jgi:predicted glycoside hydrolase/deacetylase ChbG (UPF0249 family)
MAARRYLLVTADDFGMGPATSRGIIDLALQRRVTNTLLLVNSPYAEQAVAQWQRAGKPLEIGWHPCLTLDAPLLPAHQVPSLVDGQGQFLGLGRFLSRWALGRIEPEEVHREYTAQYRRFCELVGPPLSVATHHHVQVFAPIGRILLEVLKGERAVPFLRRVCEPWQTLLAVPGARLKRLWLSWQGAGDAEEQRRLGFTGNQWLIGITNPRNVHDPAFLACWLQRAVGEVVELTCHPGYYDPSLVDRDCTATDGQQERRAKELELLRQPSFLEAVRAAGFVLLGPTELLRLSHSGLAVAA